MLGDGALKAQKVFIATPAYGGQVTVDYMNAVVQLVAQAREIGWQLHLTTGEPIITVARNNCVMEFLASDCTHMLFLDADVSFEVETIKGLLGLNQDVVLAPYPAKNLNEDKMQEFAARNGKPARLRDGLYFALHAKLEQIQSALNSGSRYCEIDAGPTGCMLIRRNVFDRLKQAYPELRCSLSTNHGSETVRYDEWWRFFDCMVSEDGEFLGEDIAFCHLWKKAGGTIWADLGAKMSHVGRHAFTGSMLGSTA